jgi:hypothetical protein
VNTFKTTLLFSLIVFSFLGNVGLRVFTHSCQEDGIFRSYVIELQDHCEDEKIETLPPCCQKERKVECGEIAKDDCCNDEVDVYKINLDYFSEYHVEVPYLNSFEKFVFPDLYLSVTVTDHFKADLYIHPPPKLSGKDILIRNQVFRI